MPLPNFLIIGAPKSATTSLAYYLGEHPEVFVSRPKEPHFLTFCRRPPSFRGVLADREWLNVNAITELGRYEALFDGAGAAKAIGEASTNSLYFEETIDGIRTYIPDTRMIAILRNPVDRAFSSFQHLLRDGRETVGDFRRALDLEERRIAENWSPLYRYVDVGRYGRQLDRYYSAFGRERIKVVLYEDLKAELNDVLAELFAFIGVSADFRPDLSKRYNLSSVSRSGAVQRLLDTDFALKSLLPPPLKKRVGTVVRRMNRRRLATLEPEVRRRLILTFRDDVTRLQDLIGRDLSAWLEAA